MDEPLFPGDAASSQQPAASSQQPAASSQQPVARIQVVFAVLMLTLACTFSVWLNLSAVSMPLSTARLIVDEKELDFGEAWEASAFRWQLNIHNPGENDITIASFMSSCSCASVKPESLTIPAGGYSQVDLVLNLSAAFAEKTHHDIGAGKPESQVKALYEAEIAPRIDDSAIQLPWIIRGQVSKVLKASPAALYLDEGFVRGQAPPKCTMRLTSYTQLKQIKATCANKDCRVIVERVAGSDDTWQLDAQFAESMPAGPFRCRIQLEPIGETDKSLPTTAVEISGVVDDIVTLIPSPLLLGPQPVGTKLKETIRFQKNVATSFSAVMIEDCPKSTRVTLHDDNAGFEIEFAAAATGQQTQTMHVVFAPEGVGPPTRIPFRVSYYGLPPKTAAKPK